MGEPPPYTPPPAGYARALGGGDPTDVQVLPHTTSAHTYHYRSNNTHPGLSISVGSATPNPGSGHPPFLGTCVRSIPKMQVTHATACAAHKPVARTSLPHTQPHLWVHHLHTDLMVRRGGRWLSNRLRFWECLILQWWHPMQRRAAKPPNPDPYATMSHST